MPNPPFAPPAPVSPTKPLTGRELIISQHKDPSLMTEEEVRKEFNALESLPFKTFRESVRKDQINKYLKTQQWDEASDLRREGEAQRQSDIAIRELGNKQIDAIESTFRQANPDSALSRDQVKDSYIKEYGKDYLSQLGYSPVWGEEDQRKRRDQAELLAGEWSDPEEDLVKPGFLERRKSDLGKGWNQMEVAWNSVGALAFDKIGADDWAESWALDAEYDRAESAEHAKTGLQTSYFGHGPKPEGILGFGEWAAGSLTELLPMVGEVAAQAGIGTLLATPGPGTVAGATSGIVFRQASRKALADATGKVLAKREALTAGTRGSLQTFLKTGNYDHLTDDALRALGDDASLAAGTVRGAEKKAIEDRLKGLGLKLESDSAQALFGHHYTAQRRVWGSTAGAFSATAPLETGGALSDYAQQMGIPVNEIDLWTGLKISAAGGVAGAADAIFPFMAANRIFARPVKAAILQSKWQKAKPVIKGMLQGSSIEGGTEIFQEAVTTAAVREAKGLDAWDFTDDEKSHMWEAGAKGAIGGLFFPAVISTARRALKWSGSKMGMTEGESVAETPSEVLSRALAKQDSKVNEMLDPEHIVPSPAASTESTESSELLDEGDSIPVSVAREPSHEQKLAIKQLVIKEAEGTITEESAAEERARLLTDQADKDFYKKTSTEVVSALAHKRKKEVEALALRAAQSNNLSEEENAALDDEVAKLSTTDKALFNKVRLDLLNRKARGEQNMDGMTKEDLLYENAPIKERREFLAAVGQRIANEPKKSLDELRTEAKSKLEKDLIDLIVEFESSDQTTTDEYMDLVLPSVASSPMQEGLAQYIWTAHTEEAAEHMVRMENAVEESKVNTGSNKAWTDHIAGVLEKWVARAVDEVTPADIKLWQLDPRNRDSLTEPEAQALNTAQARLISEEGQTEETLTAAQVVRKANEILALERKQAAAINETVAADNPTVNKAIDKVKKAPKAKKAKKPAAPEADKGRLDTEETTEETGEETEETVEKAVTNKAKKKARDEAVDREIKAALEATDDPHKRIKHLFRARQIVKRAGGRLTAVQKKAIEGMEEGLKAEGYTWESLDGKEFQIGRSTVEVTTAVDGLEHVNLRKHDGEHEVVLRTHTPEIRKDGKISKPANVDYVFFLEITEIEKLQQKINSLTDKIERPKSAEQKAGLIESRDTLQKELDEKAAEKPVEGVTTKSDLLKRFVDGVKHSGRTLSPSDQASLKDMVESGEVTAKELEASIDQLEEAMEAEMAEVVAEKPVEEEVVAEEVVAEEDKIPTLYYGTTNQEITDTVSIDLDNIVSKGRGTGFQAEGAGRYATTAREAGEWYQRGEEEKGRKGAKEGLLYEYDSNISESSVLDQSAKGIENQPEAVQKAWQAYLDLLNQDPKGNKKRLGKIKKLSADWSGYHFYGEITDYFVKTEGKSSKVGSSSKEDIYMAQVKASRFLRDNGVDAMSYSRKGKGTASNKTYKNYVILNTDKITVKKVYDHEGNVVHDASTAEVAAEEAVEEEVEGGFVLDDSPQQKNLEMRKEELKSVEEELEEWEGKLEDAEADLEVAEREHEKLEKKVSKQKKQKKAGESLGVAANTRWSKDPANAVSAGRASGVAMKVHELSGAKSTQQIKETPGKYKGKGYAPATKELVDPPQGKHFGIKALVYELLRIEGAAAPSEVVMLSELDDKGGIQLEIDGVAGIELTAERLGGEGMTVRLEKIWSIERGGALKAGKKLVAAANASGVTIVGTANPFTNPKTEKIEMTEERLIKFYEKMGATVDENGNATIKPDVKKGERAATKRLKDAIKAKQEYINETQDEVSEAEDNVDNLEGEKYTTIDEIDGLEAEIKALKQAVEIVSAVEEVKVSEKAAKPTEQAEVSEEALKAHAAKAQKIADKLLQVNLLGKDHVTTGMSRGGVVGEVTVSPKNDFIKALATYFALGKQEDFDRAAHEIGKRVLLDEADEIEATNPDKAASLRRSAYMKGSYAGSLHQAGTPTLNAFLEAEEATAPTAAPAPATVEKVAKGEVKTVGPADTSQKLAKEWETKSIHMTLVENLADIAQEGLHPRPQINEEMKALIDKGDITRDQAVLFSKHFLFYLQPHPLSTWNSKLEYHIRHVVASTQGKGMRLDEGPVTEAYSERMKKDQMVVLGFREPGESQQDMSMEDYIEVALDSGASPSPAVEKELGAELSRMTFEPVGAEDISVWTDNGWVPIADYVKGKNIGAVAEVAVEEEAVEEKAVEEKAVEEKAVEPKAKAKPKPKRKPTKAEEQKKKEKKIAAIEAQITKIQAEQADITLSVEEEASLKPLTDAEVTDTAQKLADRAEVAEEDGEVVQFKDDGNTMADRMEFLAQQLDEGVAEPNDAGMKARMQMVNELLGVIDEGGGDVEAFDLNELARLQKEYDRLRKSSKRVKGAPRSKISDMPEELQVLRRELVKALRDGSEGIKGTLYANNSGDVFYNPIEPTSPIDDFGVREQNYILIRSSAGSVSGSVAKLAEALDEQYTLPPAGEYVHMSNSMIFGDGVDVSTDPESGQAVPQRKRKVEASKTRQARESKKKTTETKRKIFKDAKPGTAINPNPTTKVEEAKVIERVLDDQQINWIAQNVVDEADLGYEGVDTIQKRGKLITQLGTDIVHRITHNDGSVKNIADYYGVSEDLILERNDMSHASEIMPGSRLIIPAPPLDWWAAGDTLTQFVKSSGAMAVGVTAQEGNKRRNVGRRALFLRDTETGLIHLSSVFFGKHLQIEDPTTGSIRKKDVSEAGFVRPKVDKDTLEFIEGSNKYEIVSLVRLRKKTGVGNIFNEYGKDMPPLNQGDYNALMRLLDVVANEEHRAKESTKRTKGETSWASAEGTISPEGVMIMDPKSYNHDATSFGVASSMEADRIPSISGNQTQAGSIFLAKLFYSMRRDRADRGSLKGTKAASLAQMDKETVLRELSYFYTKNPDILKDHLEEVYINYIDELKMEGLDAGRSWPEIMADIQSQLPDHKPRTEKEWFQMSNIAIPVVGEIVHQRLAHEGDTDLSYFTADYAEIKRTQQLDEGLQGGLSASSEQAVASHRQRETWNTSAQRRAVALTQTGVEQIAIVGVTDRALGVLKENYALQIAGMEIGEGTINGSPMALWELANTLERDNRPATSSPKIGDNKKAIRIFNERVWASIKTAVERYIQEDVSSDPTTERHSSIVREESPFGYMAAAQVQERFQFLSNVAGQYGIPIDIEEGPVESGQISMSRDNPESSIITLAMHDAAQPTANNIDNLLEELAHHVFYQLDSKQKHQLLLSINAGASNYFSTSLAKLSPAERESVLKEEDLVRSVLDSIANNRELDITEEEAATGVKALIKALMQYLKEAYDRLVMAVQGENVNPDVAERFLKRRMMAFLSGRPMPNNIFQALNLKMPEDRAKGFTQVNPEQVAARHDPGSGNYVYSAVLPDSPHAAEFNIMNSTRPQDSRLSAGDTAILLAEKDFNALTEAQKNEIIQYAFENYLELGIKLRNRTKNGITESEEAGVPSRLDGADWRIVRTEMFRRWGGQWLTSPEDSGVLLNPITKEPVKIWHVTPALALEGPSALEGTNLDRPDSRYQLPFSELGEFSWAISDRSVALNDYENAHAEWASARKQLTRHGQTTKSAPIVFGGFARAEKVLKLHSVVNSVEDFVALLEDSGVDLSLVGGAAAITRSMDATQEGAVPAFFYVNDLLELARAGDGSSASSKLLKLIREQGFGAISVQHPFEDATAYLLLEGGAQLKATTMQDWRGRNVEEGDKAFSESRDVRYSPARIKDINKPASLDVQQENVAAVDIAASNFVLQEVIDVVWDGSPAAQKLFESKDKMSALYAAIISKAVEASKEVGATVSPNITIADLDGESRQNASRTALELLDQLRAKVSIDAAEANRDLNRSIDAAVKKDQKLSELEGNYKDLTWNMSEMWGDFRGMVKELNKTVTGSVKHGKDASKLSQLLGKLEGELDSPISKNQLTLINKVLRTEYGKPYGNFNTLVDKLSQFGDEIAFGRLANEEPAAAVRRVSAAIQSKSIEMAAAPELANIMAAFMVANPLHVNLMQLRKLTVEEGRDDIIAELEAIRLGSPKTTKELEAQARATVKNRNLLTRLMIEVNKMKRDSKKATEQANTLQNTIDMGNEAAPSLLQARIQLEDELGIQVQFNLKDGSTLYVPVDKNTYPTNIKDQENQVVYFKETYKNHDADMRKMTAWLLNQPSYARGTDYRLVMQQRDSLLRDFTRNVLDVETHYGAIGLFSKIWRQSRLMPITDRMRLIGLHEGVDMVQMFSEYGQLSQLAKDLHKKGQKVTSAMHAAMEAVEEGNEEAFFSTYYDQALKHIENNKDQLANLNDEGQVLKGIEMLKKYYASHANTATARASAKGWSELEKFFKMSVTANMALRDYISNLSEGALVEDEIAGEKIYRGLIGNVWTVSRGFNEKAVSTINSMSTIWSETNSPFRNQRYNFAEDYAKNPDKFREEMAKFFTPGKLGSRVLTDFVGPILDKGGASLFLEPLVEGKSHRAAAQKTDIQEAWGKSGGDVVTFAEALWATTTSEVTEDQVSTPLDAYVGEVMQVFSSFYQNMYKSINESNNSWTGQAAPRDLMDARETESYPSEFMEFNRLDRLRIAAVANRAAMHSSFGRDFEGFQSMWDQAKRRADAINVLRKELKEKAESTGKSIPVLLKEAQSSEEMWSSLTPTKLKNAERVVEDLTQIKHEFKGWINLASGRTLDDTVLMEVIGAVAGNAVQGVKTIVNDTSALVFNPIMNMGVNAHGTRALWETGKHFIGQTGNTLLNAAYRDFRIGFEFDALANKYGAVDGTASDLYGQLTQVMNSASSNLEIMSAERNRPIPQGANKLQRGLVKFARTLSASKEMGMGQAREGEQDAPTDIVLQPLGPFGTFAMIGQMSAAHGMANTAAYFVLRGAEYYAKNPSYKGEITQEMLGGWEGVAPDKAIMFMREQMALHGGMNMDEMARKAGEEIRDKGKVTPFIDAEFLRLMYLSAQSNITGEATFSSRPSYFLTSTTGRIINPLFGWAINQAYKSTFRWNRNEDMSRMEGASSKLKYYFLPMVGALGYVTVMAMLRDELEEEVLGVKQRGIDPLSWRGMVDAVDRVGMFGMFGSVANEAVNTESSRTWSIENRVLLINTTKQLFNLTFRLHQTGYNMNYENLWRPMIQLMGGGGYLQYGQILNNAFSLDNAEARYSARLNAKNAIISAGKELKMDIKKGGGGWAPTPVTPYVTQMEIAAMANDSNRFRAARQSAIEKAMVLRNESRHEAEKYVDTRFASNHPMRKAFKAYPTSKDISKLYDQMSDESEGDVKEAVRLYNHYLEQLGRGGFKGSGLSGKKQVDPLAIPQRGGSRQRNRDKEMLDKLLNR